jgi:hypothetical protein
MLVFAGKDDTDKPLLAGKSSQKGKTAVNGMV